MWECPHWDKQQPTQQLIIDPPGQHHPSDYLIIGESWKGVTTFIIIFFIYLSHERLALVLGEFPGVALYVLFTVLRPHESVLQLSGKLTLMMRSNLPGRTNAGSKTSLRFVAARTHTLFDESKPSIHASNWFNVCSASSLLRKFAPSPPRSRDFPNALK